MAKTNNYSSGSIEILIADTIRIDSKLFTACNLVDTMESTGILDKWDFDGYTCIRLTSCATGYLESFLQSRQGDDDVDEGHCLNGA